MSISEPDQPHPLPRLAGLTAAVTACAGIGLEIAARELFRPGHPVWLIKPFLYAGVPQSSPEIKWGSVLTMAGMLVCALFVALIWHNAPTYPARWLRVGIGLVIGGSAGQMLTEVALYHTTHIFAAARGSWQYAFSPFDLAFLVGFLLVLPEFFLPGSRILRNPKGPLHWRDIVRGNPKE